MTAASLLPADDSNFRSSQYWQGFFDSRGTKSFEWYGDWRQLKPLVQPICNGRAQGPHAGLWQQRPLRRYVRISADRGQTSRLTLLCGGLWVT